jgi:hypothetical protein
MLGCCVAKFATVIGVIRKISTMGFIVFIVIIVGVGLFIAAKKSAETARANWQSAARILNLMHVPGSAFSPGTIAGIYGGHRVGVSTFTKGSGKNSSKFTKFRITYQNPVGFHFTLKKQGVLHSFGKMLGMQDIETGDKSFDDAALVQGVDRQAILRFLIAPRRQAILAALAAFHEVIITDQSIEINIRGMQKDPSTIVAHIRRIAQLADAMAGVHRVSAGKEDEPRVRKKLPPELPAARLRKNRPARPPARTGIHRETPPPLNPPAPPPVMEKPTHPPDNDARPAEPTEKAPPPSAPSKSIAAEEFFERVFDSRLGALNSTRMFENEYMGSLVEWEGDLISASEFSVDFVFKNKSGVKATFEIQKQSSARDGGKIIVIVHFPKDQLEALKKSLRRKTRFSGKLLGVDGLMKKVFLAEGRLS